MENEEFCYEKELAHLLAVVSGSRFLQKQGLGNEVPFFIYPYKAKFEDEVVTLRRSLVKELKKKKVRVLSIDLYDLSVDILQQRGIWEQVLETESGVEKEQLKELLQGVLDPQAHIIPAIAARMQAAEFDVLFLSGVGQVYPYIRSHNILNNLQSTAKEQPTLMFFPGEYTQHPETGASLDLFGLLHDDKYYRAFNIFECEP